MRKTGKNAAADVVSAANVRLRDKLNACLDILVAVHPHASHADCQTALKKLGEILMENKPK